MSFVPARRRAIVALGTALALPPGLAPAGTDRSLALSGPPAGPSITLAHAVGAGMLAAVGDPVSFRVWRTPDEMRAGLTSGTAPLVVMPTTVAANLHNRGFPIRLLNVMTDGLLHVVAADPALDSLPKLAGKRLAVPFRNDTPEFVLARLLKSHRMQAGRDLSVDTTGTPIEAVQLLLAGRIDAALVPEPAATAAIMRAAAAGRTLHRTIDVQREWARATGQPASLPQAGLAATDRWLQANADRVDPLLEALARATADVLAAPARAAAHASAPLELGREVIERSIPHSRLVADRAARARPRLEALFSTVAEADPALIGGRLPPSGFYL